MYVCDCEQVQVSSTSVYRVRVNMQIFLTLNNLLTNEPYQFCCWVGALLNGSLDHNGGSFLDSGRARMEEKKRCNCRQIVDMNCRHRCASEKHHCASEKQP